MDDTDCDAASSATICVDGVCHDDMNGCGGTCENNFQCDSLKCNRCVNDICSPGALGGESCSVDSDCSQVYLTKWCLADSNGIKTCKAQCDSPCTSDDQCGDPGCGHCNVNGAGPNKICG